MQLSRLQRIYHQNALAYDELEESLAIVPTTEIRRTYFFSRKRPGNEKPCLVSQGSDLEAFSRNPTRGSFGALAFQPAPLTKYANYVFLSY